MLSSWLYRFRTLFWKLGNLIRRMKKAPEYVVFILEGDYPDIPKGGGNLLIRRFRPPKVSLLELADQFRCIAEDPRVKGVVLHLRPLDMPLTKIEYLRNLIGKLRAAGKRVLTWSYTYDTSMYYLASAADEIILLPGGSLAPMGLYRRYTYLSDALEKVGLKADFLQITPYKSAVDTFTRSSMSDEVREMGNWLADSAFEEILDGIAVGRKIGKDSARELVDQTPCTDLKAMELGAIDRLLGEDDLPEFLGDDGKPAQLVPWYAARRWVFRQPPKKAGKYVALMSIEGMIVDGYSGQPPVEPPIPVPLVMDERAGDLSVVGTARQIMTDKRAAGVILYVNSRGGSATASESMRIALEKIATQKPLVIVMGPVAASGGYWVSTPGKYIFAQPSTITGSIGVLTGKIINSDLLARLFIHQEAISRGANIRIYESEASFTEGEKAQVWEYMQRIYSLFLERVSTSRSIETGDVDGIGGGRVWTGRQALAHGLIDELGGIDQALEKIRDLADLDSQSPIRIYTPGKQYLSPVPEITGILNYGFEGIKLISERVMCLCPWVE